MTFAQPQLSRKNEVPGKFSVMFRTKLGKLNIVAKLSASASAHYLFDNRHRGVL